LQGVLADYNRLVDKLNTDTELIKSGTHKNGVLQGVQADYNMLVDKLNTGTELIKSRTHKNIVV
jgi:ClpP class serine protease